MQPESGEFMVDFGFRTCYGFNYPKHRREGATYKAALINYEITSRKLSSIGGIQSKDEESAKKDVYEKVIDLTGPDGNAFALIGYATKFARQLDLDSTQIREEMMAGDYENLVAVFDKYFGDYVTLER